MVEPIAYAVPDAAAAVGVSETTLREAHWRGEIEFHYPTTRPVVLHDDLVEWIRSAPTEPRAERR